MAARYDALGVDTRGVEGSLRQLGAIIQSTFDYNQAAPLLPLGYFANVIRVSRDLGIAISTDGVGTKILVAQQMDRYDTVGIDCVAMNANDIICVGARPISMVDYIAVERLDDRQLAELASGLREGAARAGVNIPGGEIAQVREMIHGSRDGKGFDLVGTCIGTVHPDELIIGAAVQPGDVVVGLASSGIHSNGFTLARHALFGKAGLAISDTLPEVGRTVGEALLEPTRMYVRAVVEMIDRGLAIRSLSHITGDGLMNLARIEAAMGFVIDEPLAVPPIFTAIAGRGGVEAAEMYTVFNMGIGFCIVVADDDAKAVLEVAESHGHAAAVVGYAVADARRRVWLPRVGLLGEGKAFAPTDEPPPANPRA
jgi:phosphoribosylformylglycinamidine cyclo-ligase